MQTVHIHSRESYEKCREDGDFKRIIWRIAKYYEDRKDLSFTDRDVKDVMYGLGLLPFDDMNMVRPKITKLIKDGLLREVGEMYDHTTKRKVRLVQWDPGPVQRELF